MLTDLEAAIHDQLVRRNGEVLAYILAHKPQQIRPIVPDDNGPDRMINEGGFVGFLVSDPDDYSSEGGLPQCWADYSSVSNLQRRYGEESFDCSLQNKLFERV